MKKLTIILILLTSAVLSAQERDITVIEESYQYAAQKPLLIRKGSILKFEADSIYLVNPGRYLFYEKLRQILDQDLGCDEIIQSYQNSVEQNSQLINDLLINSKKSEKLTQTILYNTSTALDYTFMQLQENDKLLNNAIKNIDNLKIQLKKAKRKKIINYGIIGISGLTAGYIISKI